MLHLFLVVLSHLTPLLFFPILCLLFLYCLDSLLLLDLPFSLLCFLLFLVVFLLLTLLLLSTRFNNFLHLFVVQLSLDLHFFCMLLLLVFEQQPTLLDLSFSHFELFVEFSECLLVSLSSLPKFFFLFMTFEIGLFFLFFVKLLHHSHSFLSFPIHLLLALNH